ncbi:MAG: DUF4292 domain-containing protein [Flavobacteriaceae bacterium]|jgi:hypothetical protein|nr:DUF4292 domain-containing protein [Flavobacteriaceae bacterium]
MKKILVLLFATVSLIGCKSKKIGTGLDEVDATNHKTALLILNEHSKNAQDFSTSQIRTSINFESDTQSNNASADIMIEKDKQIFMNVRFLGFTVAKALITPEKVQYYEVVNKNYFDGDFSILSQYVGTDLDFNKLQNLLLGQVLDSKSNQNLLATIEGGLHKLSPAKATDLTSHYYFEDKGALLKKEEIEQKSTNRKVTISYPAYQQVKKYVVPTEINIQAVQEKSINLNLRYDKVTFDEELRIKYTVPSGYKRIGFK